MRKLTLLTSFTLCGLAATAVANGFNVNEFDGKATGRGDAEAATDTDASSIYFNVGGLPVASGTQVMIGGSLIAPSASFTDATTGTKTDSTTSPQVIPGVFISSKLNKLVAVGVGFYTPFGLALSWPAGAQTNDVVSSEALRAYFITPSVGLDLDSYVPGLSVGAGVDLVPATVELHQDIYFGTDRGNASLGGSAFGVGARVGAMYRPAKLRQLSIGAMWRSEVKEDFTGTGDFNAPPPYRSTLPPDGDIKTSVTLPQSVTFGASYQPTSAFDIEADLVWMGWSTFKSLDIMMPTATGDMTISSSAENYKDTWTVRAGAEYKFEKQGAAVRAGFIYDPTPVPASTLTVQLPDVDRYDVTVGGSMRFSNYDIHLGLLWVLPTKRTTGADLNMPEYKGTFDIQAFVASLSLAGRFGQ